MSLFKFLFTLISGAALGLLFAKKEGKKLRDKLKGKNSKEIAEILGQEFVEAGKDVKKTVREISEKPEVKKMIKTGKTEIGKFIHKTKEVIEDKAPEVEDQIKETVEKIPSKMQNTVNKIKKAIGK